MSDKLEIVFDHYIVIKDGEVTGSSLSNQITFNDHTLDFTLGAPIDIHVILLLSKDYNLNYNFHEFVKANVIETRVLNNNVTFNRNITVDETADINIFNENMSSPKFNLTFNDQGNVNSYANVHLGYAELSDNNVDASYHYNLNGNEAMLKLRMATLSKNDENKKYKVSIEHNAPYTTGIMDNFGVAKDSSSLTIDGIGKINKGQNKSESHQTNKIMVFDEKCKASANPYLFIDEYDVAASHAAAVGKMDEEHLYYLQTRGLTFREAMQLITYGYLKPVVEIVDNKMLKERFEIALEKVGD